MQWLDQVEDVKKELKEKEKKMHKRELRFVQPGIARNPGGDGRGR